MSVLVREDIIEEWKHGSIEIEPFNEDQVSPNSYNVRLDRYLLALPKGYKIDMENPPKREDFKLIDLSKKRYTLKPGRLYLGSTIEKVGSDTFVTSYEGRSSLGRIGFESHICAGLGDVGFKGSWTLEIRVTNPTKLPKWTERSFTVGQMVFFVTSSDPESNTLYTGQYSNLQGPQPARVIVK